MAPTVSLGYLWLDVVALALFTFIARAYVSARAHKRGLKYPPGPSGLPLLGNLLDIPQHNPWVTYAEWGKRYGDVTSVSVLGRLIVFVNTARAAKVLFERTGTRYMDRPVIPIIEMMEAHFNLAITRYSDKWRVERRIVDQSLRPAVAVTYYPMQIAKAHAFLRQTMEYLKHFTGAVVMSLTYGYDVKESGDHYVAIAEELLTLASESILPGALLVNDFPALKHIPDWFPGTAFKQRARHGKKLSYEMVNAPFNMVKEDLLKGTAKHSLVHDNLDECKGDEETALKNAAASVYAAGAETTISTLSSFLLSLLLYPDVQQHAQAEIDRVIGRTRLPAFSDRPNLPYIDAICKELLRWRLVLPLSVAHATTEDDVYNGYFIPKGTTVLPNTWGILHDPEVYPDPETFKPERFLTEDGKVKDDPLLMYAFGYGRRMCPGRHLVDSTLWILVASVLSAFKVHKKIDMNGNEIPVEGLYGDGLISHPAPFQYAISPRHPGAARLIQETEEQEE
ncbi:cytochrome P450 [Multifurca ochricompacta]|uniref:Cytochrome P450 n=1 Tax=Multifurca ochricompacta TaxID=376703 RepID=A0AAD4LYG9_9AGAM|nr:cytochrome P450 [Multifurca ochricompacta]